jgi:uncharacterized membrane protein YhfC
MALFVRALNAALMIALPLALGITLARRLRVSWRLFGVGVVTFLASQLVHIPFNGLALGPALEGAGLANPRGIGPLAAVATLLGLSAGVFEEGARYLTYRFWLRDSRSWSGALMFGAGHGGIEAMALGGLALYGLIQALALRGADLSELVPLDQIATVRAEIEAYWALPWHQAILGAVERASALGVQLGLSVMVLQSLQQGGNPASQAEGPAGRIRRGGLHWLALAVAWHTLTNAAGIFALMTWGVYVSEGVIALFGLASVGLILALRPQAAPPVETSGPPPPFQPRPIDPTLEKLEDSRYV